MLKGICIGGAMMVAATPSLAAPFQFENQVSLDDMRSVVQKQFSAPSTRDQVRQVFVSEGGGTLVAHPRRTNVEKYIYDINLCSYYVWRWNISADYGRDGKLEQLFVNGTPALHDAQAPALPKKGPFYQLARGRPEAFKGEKSLAAIVSDEDGNLKTTDDMLILTGVGPTRADPLNMGRALNHPGEVWRSIFDFDQAKSVMPYRGDCSAVDAAMATAAASRAP